MIEAIERLSSGFRPTETPLSEGKYNVPMPMNIEATLLHRFEYYRWYYDLMRGA